MLPVEAVRVETVPEVYGQQEGLFLSSGIGTEHVKDTALGQR